MFYSIGAVVLLFGGIIGAIDMMEVEKKSPVAKRSATNGVVPYDGMPLEHGLLKPEDEPDQ